MDAVRMPPLFDAYVMVDWSAAAVPATGTDSVWIDSAERRDGALTPLRLANPRTRREAAALLADLLSDLVARDCVTLVGFDFAFGYPAGFAQRLHRPGADWRSVWREIAARVRDADNNANNRFEVAAALNQRISGRPFPFWGCPATAAGPLLAARKPAGYGDLAEFRMCDLAGGGAHPVWKLAYPGCVGSQTLLGIAHLQALRQHPWLVEAARIWPFETGLRAVQRPAAGEWRLLFAEIYPSIFDSRAAGHAIKDARQVQTVVERLRVLDEAGRLAPLFAGPPTLTPEQRLAIETEEGWILGIETTDLRPRGQAASTTPAAVYDYVRDPEEIYRRSVAAIRAEADLSALPADLEPLAVRLIHAAGDPGIVRGLAWTEDAFAAGRRALAGGAPILVDTEMVAAGIIRARLPAENTVVCTMADPDLAEAAQAIGNTRSAAAVDRWLDRLEGALVAIGNAPTALFRLLELLDGGAPRPAVILGFPVGFVGATEAKEALIAHPLRVPFVTLCGRRGGSAIAAAAINALAGDAVCPPGSP